MSRLAILTGNGLSIPGNEGLKVDLLTSALKEKFSGLGGNGTSEALRDLSAALGGGAAEDNFEDLLGPLDSAANGLTAIEPLLEATSFSSSNPKIRNSIEETCDFLGSINRIGSAITLKEIYKESRDPDVTRDFMKRLADVKSKCVIGSLNYDGLMYRAALELSDSLICDLADGRGQECVPVVGGSDICGHRLRQSPNFY